MPLPGIDESSLDVAVEGQSLRIRGTKNTVREQKRRNYHRVEKISRVFERAIAIPSEIDHPKVAATLRDGVLTVRLPKPGASSTVVQRVPVNSDGARA